jgi:hypothetical protein
MDGAPSWERLADALKKRGTIEWPDDERVRSAILSRKIYKVGIKNYLLGEFDRGIGGDVPSDIPWIEHILPQTLNSEWSNGAEGNSPFTAQEHDSLVDTWGNLVCLSERMNIEVSQAGYAVKRKFFSESSMYGSARAMAKEYDYWSPETIRTRSKSIADWAVTRWKR